jgi:FMN phosphatase YigB (HAD superfamily)
MKLILDFDDTLFDSAKLKENFFEILGKNGVLRASEQYHYERKDDRPFSLRLFVKRLCSEAGITEASADRMYDEIVGISSNLLDPALVRIMRELGSENCILVTNGDEDFQGDKIRISGARELVGEYVIVPGTKKQVVEWICQKYPQEKVVFVDDKQKFFDDLDLEKCRNLKTVLYDENGLANLKKTVGESR